MKTLDIVCPTGGLRGGVENVLKKWTAYIDSEKYNLRLFHCHDGISYLGGYPKAYCTNVPFERADLNFLAGSYAAFIRKFGPPDLCIATNWPMMVLACAAVRQEMGLWEMKLASWIHSKISVYEENGLGGVYEVLNADYHFALCNGIAEEIRDIDPNANIFVIGNPVDEVQLSEGDRDPYALTYVGRLDESKGIEVILKALSMTNGPWHLSIVGDGEIKKEITEWIRLYRLEKRVRCLGWSSDPWAENQEAGICILASEYEGFALVAIEASAHGKTIISTPVFGVPDYIKEGENGYLFPFGDASALAHILNSIESGKLSRCNPADCAASVSDYLTPNYFRRVDLILKEILQAK